MRTNRWRLLTLVAVMLAALPAMAEEFVVGALTYNTLNDTECEVRETTGYDLANIGIANSVTLGGRTYKITQIAENGFKGKKKLRRIIIDNGLIEIKLSAFEGSGVEDVQLPATLGYVKHYAFRHCS